jgi:hypothetical protein
MSTLAIKEHTKRFNIVVEVDGKNVHVQFDHSPVTGHEIREQAGAQLSDDLVRLERGKPEGGNIGLEDPVDIKNGDHFQILPAGTVS